MSDLHSVEGDGDTEVPTPVHTLYCVWVNVEGILPAIARIREAALSLGSPMSDLSVAEEAVTHMRDGDISYFLVGASEDHTAVENALALLERDGHATGLLNPTQEILDQFQRERDREFEEAQDDDEGNFSPAALHTAMLLLHTVEGDLTKSVILARALAHNSGDYSLYAEVEDAILATFPPLGRGGKVIR